MQRRSHPKLKGVVNGSKTTLSPATKIIFLPKEDPTFCKAMSKSCGSASV